MHRRDVLRLLGSTAIFTALSTNTPERLWAIGGRAHRSARRGRRLFSAEQAETVAAIAERIIPTTDTPGARDAGVAAFADVIVAERFEPAERSRFLAGLADVDARSQAMHGALFGSLDPARQDALLQVLEQESLETRALDPDAPSPFFRQVKWLTLYGYYTSEIGQTQELHAVIVPGRYDPCAAVGRTPPGEG